MQENTTRSADQLLKDIKSNIEKVIVGKGEVIDLVLTALLCSGHVLIEDVPGLGKTTLVSALAKSLGCSFKRVQFTPDVLPSDVTGYTMFDMKTGEKQVQFGAVMSQMVLADEINRTSPKTQSSLLEVMQEGTVTIDSVSYEVPKPFMVLATQNPVDLTGTYPLPEAQLDRFLMRIKMGYPEKGDEIAILKKNKGSVPVKELNKVASAQDILDLQEKCKAVTCSDSVMDYIVSIADATRKNEYVQLGVSPRGSLALMNASMALAMLRGRDYVIPDDVQFLAQSVLAHRLVMNTQATFKGQTTYTVIRNIIMNLRVPGTK
ncbi:MAG: MoxR family ATPase [Clostridia bacterium]|nr:MoxR family ATPase [Clostridia bacterium]